LHRNAVHHHAGHQRHEADDEEEAGGELGAEHAGADAPHQDIGLVADEDDEADGGDGGGAQQERKVFREEGGVVRRRHQQRDQGGAQQQTGGDQVDHAGHQKCQYLKVRSCQPESSCQRAEEASALTWSGLGSWAMSRYMRM
jgi:hypothetical protein